MHVSDVDIVLLHIWSLVSIGEFDKRVQSGQLFLANSICDFSTACNETLTLKKGKQCLRRTKTSHKTVNYTAQKLKNANLNIDHWSPVCQMLLFDDS